MKLSKSVVVISILLGVLVSSISFISSVKATETQTLHPIADAYVDSYHPSANYGGDNYLDVDFWDYEIFEDERRNTYLLFDLAFFSPELHDIYSAVLHLYAWSAWSPTAHVGVHYCSDVSWDEIEITWQNAPSFSPNASDIVAVPFEDTWYTWNVTDDVQDALGQKLTLVLTVEDTGESFSTSFRSKDGYENYPELVIEYLLVLPDTIPPVANAGPDQTVDEDTPVNLDGSGSTDNVEITSYTWTFIDVTPQTLTGVNPIYTFKMPGEYTITLNVTDAAGNWGTDTVRITVLDVTNPSISVVSHEPEIPDDGETVTVTVDVTDEESGVRNVTISYSTDGGENWNNVIMERMTGDTYKGEIPGLTAETNVQYKIIAYDNANNSVVEDNAGKYYVYTVIPEFSIWTMLLILVMLTVLTAIYKRRLLKTPIH